MALTDKWIDLIHKTATGNAVTKLILAPVAGFLYFSFISLFVFLSISTDRYLQLPEMISSPWTIIVSAPIILIGFILMVLSVIAFLKVKGTPVPLSPPPELVVTGPYRYARNPMLTGIFLQLFGIAILLSSISLLVFFTPLFIIINAWELKKIEEPELEKRLGQAYVDYKNRVPMFFPKITKYNYSKTDDAV